MKNRNVVNFTVRFNLDDDYQYGVYKKLNRLDKDLWKSKNQFAIEALDYCLTYGRDKKNSLKDDFLKCVSEAVTAGLKNFFADSISERLLAESKKGNNFKPEEVKLDAEQFDELVEQVLNRVK